MSSLLKLYGNIRPRFLALTLSDSFNAYFIGGLSPSVLSRIDIFTSVTGSWKTSFMKLARWGAAAVLLGDKIVIGGGYLDFDGTSSSTYVEIFDTIKLKSEIHSTGLSVARGQLTSSSNVDVLALFVGGIASSNNLSPYASVDIFNLTSGSFVFTSLSSARFALGSAYTKTVSLFVGGLGVGGVYSDRVDIFRDGVWSTSMLSNARSDIVGTTMGSILIFGGGYNDITHESDVVDIFDTISFTWRATSLPVARTRMSVAAVGCKVLFGGGFMRNAPYISDSVDVYDFSTLTWTSLSGTLPVGVSDLSAISIGDLAIFAGGSNIDNVVQGSVSYFSFCPPGIFVLSSVLVSIDTVLRGASCSCALGKFDNGTACVSCPAGAILIFLGFYW